MAGMAGSDEDETGDSECNVDMTEDGAREFITNKELCQKYRLLKDEVIAHQNEYIHGDTEKMATTLDTMKDMYEKVRTPMEALQDSRLLDYIADINKKKAKALNTDLVKFVPEQFAFKLVNFVGGENVPDDKVSPEGWKNLGQFVQPFFSRAPSFHFLFGSFERGELQLRRVQRQRREKDTGAEKVVQPRQLTSFDEKNEATTQEVERIYEILKKQFQTHSKQLCFFEFVVNPHSFGLTIENMFHVSFLVRDGYVTVQLDDDGLPVISPQETQTQGSEENRKSKQNIFSLTPQQWREIVQVFEIQEPLIPPRPDSSTNNGTPQASGDSRTSAAGGRRR